MARGEGPGWHRESRRHHDAAMDGRRPRTSAQGHSHSDPDMSKMQENALIFAINNKRIALEEANLPEFKGEIKILRNAREKLRYGGSIGRLNRNQLKNVESALEMTLEDMSDGSSYRDYDSSGSFNSIRKKDLQGALAKVRGRL